MKVPSLHYLSQKAINAFIRFPFTIISSALGVMLAIYMMEYSDEIDNIFPYLNSLLCLALGIPLFFLASIFSETKGLSARKLYLVQAGGIVLLLLIYFSLPDKEVSFNISLPYIRYALYNAIIHLAVSFIPYLKNGNLNGFWQYNKSLFLRLLAAVLYSGVLYVGLCIALISLDILFDVEVPDKLWFELFIVIIGFFNTWFFVAGVPENFEELEETKKYPKGLKFFTQYILLPLLILYLLILYAYLFKIVIGWTWPEGIVSYLIVFVSVLGILANLLIYPFRNSEENSWIGKFSTVYYFALVPLIVVLFIAIGMRISDYGITINRYAIVLLGIWLSFTALYFDFKGTNIKLIPMSLALLMFLVSFGPWGVFSVSERSQVNRLQTILEENQILQNGKIINEAIWYYDEEKEIYTSDNFEENSDKLNDSLYNEVYSIMHYLDDHHGFNSIDEWTMQNMDSLVELKLDDSERWRYRSEADIYLQTFGLEQWRRYYVENEDPSSTFIYYSTKAVDAYPISDFDYFITIGHNYGVNQDSLEEYEVDSMHIKMIYPKDINTKLILRTDNDSLSFDLETLVMGIHEENDYQTNNDLMLKDGIVEAEGNHYRARIFTTRINLSDTTNITRFYGKLLLKRR